jgi:hypothetical protein
MLRIFLDSKGLWVPVPTLHWNRVYTESPFLTHSNEAVTIPTWNKRKPACPGQCCWSGMLIPEPGSEFFHPGSRIQGQKIPDPVSRIHIKEFLRIFNLKNRFSRLSEDMIRDVYLGTGSPIRILIFTHPGSRDQKGTGSRIPSTVRCYLNKSPVTKPLWDSFEDSLLLLQHHHTTNFETYRD